MTFKKNIFLFLTLFAAQLAFAGLKNDPDSARFNVAEVFSISAGKYYPDFSDLNNQLKSFGAENSFLSISAVGLNCNLALNVALFSFDAGISLESFLPQKVSVNDSLSFRLNGWHLISSIYGIRIIDKPHLAIIVGPGVDWGRMNITRTLDGDKIHYNNPWIAPLARVELRFTFWRIMFGTRASYRYEITKNQWKPETPNSPAFFGTKFSGMGMQFFIGYGRVHYR
ncbi:hypothetical protein BH11BAC7_BH11BAC7_03200 [soil metagenome]